MTVRASGATKAAAHDQFAVLCIYILLFVGHGSGLGPPAWDPYLTARSGTVTTLTPDNDIVLSWHDGVSYYWERRNMTDISDVAWSVSRPKELVIIQPDGAYTDPLHNLMYIRIMGYTADGWGTPVQPHTAYFVGVSDGQLVTNPISNQQWYHVGGGGHTHPRLDVHPRICVDQVFWYGWLGLPWDTKAEIYRYDRESQAYVNRFQDSTTYTGTYQTLTPIRRNVEGVACPVITTGVTAISHFFAVLSDGLPGPNNWLMKMNLDYEVEYEVQMPANCRVQRMFSSEIFTHRSGEHLLLIPRNCNSRMGAWGVFARNGTIAWSYSDPSASVSSDVITAEIEPVTGNAIILGKANGDMDGPAGPETHAGNWDSVVMILGHEDGDLLALRQIGTEWEDRPQELLFRGNYKDVFIRFDVIIGATASSFKGLSLPTSQARSIVTHVNLGSCPPGSYIAGFLGSTVCSLCPPGSYQENNDSLSCTKCPAGTTSTEGSIRCEPCRSGTYAPSEGSTFCRPCPLGKYSISLGATTCFSCLQGTFSNEESGATTCTACPIGTYENEIESGKCKECPSGSTTRGPLASLVTMCECEEGYFGDLSTSDSACQKCPDHTKCTMGTKHPNPEPGFWISPTNGREVYACVPPEACSSSAGGDGSDCVAGYSGDSCNNCAEGYYRQGTFCYECPSSNVRFDVVTAVIMIAIAYSIFISVGIAAAALGASLERGNVVKQSPRDLVNCGVHIQRVIHPCALTFPALVFGMQLVAMALIFPLALPQSLDWFATSARLYTFQVDNIFPNECAFSWSVDDRAELRQWLFVVRQLLPYGVFFVLVPTFLVPCGVVGLGLNIVLRARQWKTAAKEYTVLVGAKYLRALDLAYFAFHLTAMTTFSCFQHSDSAYVLLNELSISCSSSHPAVMTSYTIAAITIPLVSFGYPVCLSILHAVAAWFGKRTRRVHSEKIRSIIVILEAEVSPHFEKGQRYWHSIHTWERFLLGTIVCSGVFSLTDAHMYLLVSYIALFLLYVAVWPYLHPEQDFALALSRTVSIAVLVYGLFDMLTDSNGLSTEGSTALVSCLVVLVLVYKIAMGLIWLKCLFRQYADSCNLKLGRHLRHSRKSRTSFHEDVNHCEYGDILSSPSAPTSDDEKLWGGQGHKIEMTRKVKVSEEYIASHKITPGAMEKPKSPEILTMKQMDAKQRFQEAKAKFYVH